MIDQNIQPEGASNLPVQPVGEINPQSDSLVNNQPDIAVDPPVAYPPVGSVPPASPSSPTVVVPGGGGGVPKWFYFIFGITIIVFLVVTALLVMQFTQKPSTAPEVVPTFVPRVSLKSELPTPTLASVNLATDSALIKLGELGMTDEVASIETDLENTDLSSLDQGWEMLDKEFGANTN